MKLTRALVLAAALAIPLGGCAELQKLRAGFDVATSATVSPDAVVYAASAFDVIEVTATNYQRLRRCNGANAPICRDPALRTRIDGAIYAGRTARNNLKAFLRSHPGQLGPSGDYDALIAATKTLEEATAAYRAATQ